MSRDPQPSTDVRPGEVTSSAVLLGRLAWMILGPILLLFIASAISMRGGWFTGWHGALVLVVAVMVGGRWVELRSGAAMTATGEPATMEHFKRYVRILLPLGAGAWIAASVVGNHVLS